MRLPWFGQLLVIGLILVSCEKKKDSPILLFLTPRDPYSVCVSGEILKTQIEIQSVENLKKLYITRQLDNQPSVTLLDSTIMGTKFSMSLEVNSPIVSDSGRFLLVFQAIDVKNNQISQPWLIIVKNPGFLIESTGYIIYSHAGTKQDAFNLSNKTSIYSNLSDSTQVDLMDATNDTINPNVLSRMWKSRTGVRFVRYKDFDYANATFNSLANAFEAGVKSPFISNLADDDIILLKTSKNRYYAIRFVYVIDNDLASEDRYIFNIKEPSKTSK